MPQEGTNSVWTNYARVCLYVVWAQSSPPSLTVEDASWHHGSCTLVPVRGHYTSGLKSVYSTQWYLLNITLLYYSIHTCSVKNIVLLKKWFCTHLHQLTLSSHPPSPPQDPPPPYPHTIHQKVKTGQRILRLKHTECRSMHWTPPQKHPFVEVHKSSHTFCSCYLSYTQTFSQ